MPARIRVSAENDDFGIAGNNPKLCQVRTIIRTAAPSDASVLIEGESGTGKELIATALHVHSDEPRYRSFGSTVLRFRAL